MMKGSVIILLLIIIFDCTVFTSAVSNIVGSSSGSEDFHFVGGMRDYNYEKGLKRAKNIPWKPEDENALLDIWDKTHPYVSSGHGKRIYEEWSTRFPNDKRFNRGDLVDKATNMIVEAQPRNTESGIATVEEQLRRLNILKARKKFPFTPQLKNDLLKFHQEARPGTEGYAERMHNLWARKHPTLADFRPEILNEYGEKFKNKLMARTRIIKDKPSLGIDFSDQQKAELMEIWDCSANNQSKSSQEEKIYRVWKRRYSGMRVTPSELKQYADYLVWKDTEKRLAEGEESDKLTHRKQVLNRGSRKMDLWTVKDKSQLIDEYEGREKGYGKSQKFYKKWIAENPKYSYYNFNTIYTYYLSFSKDPEVIRYRAERGLSMPQASAPDHQLLKTGNRTDREASSSHKSRQGPRQSLSNSQASAPVHQSLQAGNSTKHGASSSRTSRQEQLSQLPSIPPRKKSRNPRLTSPTEAQIPEYYPQQHVGYTDHGEHHTQINREASSSYVYQLSQNPPHYYQLFPTERGKGNAEFTRHTSNPTQYQEYDSNEHMNNLDLSLHLR